MGVCPSALPCWLAGRLRDFSHLWLYFPAPVSCRTPSNPVRCVASLPFYRRGNWGSATSAHLLKISQPRQRPHQHMEPSLSDSPCCLLYLQDACECVSQPHTCVAHHASPLDFITETPVPGRQTVASVPDSAECHLAPAWALSMTHTPAVPLSTLHWEGR